MKITKKQLKHIIKEETEKAIADKSVLNEFVSRSELSDILGGARDQDKAFAAEDKEEREEALQQKLAALDDPKETAEQLQAYRAKYEKIIRLIDKYRDYMTDAKEMLADAQEDLEEAEEDAREEIEEETSGASGMFMDDEDEREVANKIRRRIVVPAQRNVQRKKARIAKIEMRAAKLEAKAKDTLEKFKSLKQLLKAKKEQGQEQEAIQQSSDKGASDSWVGKGWREVTQALKSEFNIQPVKNWYKKLPMQHPARVKYREWYKSRRG